MLHRFTCKFFLGDAMRKLALVLTLALSLAGAALAGESVVPFRLPDAKVGEWTLFLNTSGERTGEQARFSVKEVKGGDDKVVVILYERFDASGQPIEERDIELNIADMKKHSQDLEDKAKQISRERLAIKDKEITVWAISWDDEENNREFKVWISGELPVGGLAKSWSSDPNIPAAELIDYGF